MIRFFEVATGDELGTLTLEGGALRATGIAESMTGSGFASTLPPEKVMEFYTDWSNGYVRSAATS